MKKILSLILILIIMLAAEPTMADGFAREESFEFDIYTRALQKADESSLMEIDEDVKNIFEETITAVWENMDSEVKLYPDIKIKKDDIEAFFMSVLYERPEYLLCGKEIFCNND